MERTNSRRRKPGGHNMNEATKDDCQVQEKPSPSRPCENAAFTPAPWQARLAYVVLSLLVFGSLGTYLLGHFTSFSWTVGNHAKTPFESQHSTGDYDGPEDLRIILHPEDHVNRPPTTLVYDWTITKGYRTPDGVRKSVYLIDDNFPGETIEARSGDRLVVNVTNQLINEGLAMHWHGLRLKGANDMDGAVGITQNSIPSGSSFLYNFTIGEEEHGTFWYHGHEKTQRDDGLYGGLVVHRPREQCVESKIYDYDQEILLMVGDWYHRPSTDVLAWYMNSRSFGNEPVPDSLVVNGKGNYDCDMAVPARPVHCTAPEQRETLPELSLVNGRRYRMRVVNTGSLTGFTMRISNATLSPVQVDGGHEIITAEAQKIGIIYPGERVDAILQTYPSDDRGFLEIEMDDENFKYPNPALDPQQNFPVKTTSKGVGDREVPQSIIEYYNLQAAVSNSTGPISWPEEALRFVVYTTTMKLARYSNVPMGFINHTSWQPQALPSGPLISLSRDQYDRNQLSPHIPLLANDSEIDDPSNGWVELVINNLDDGGHPFHLHGYSFYVVSIFPHPRAWTSEKPPFTPGGTSLYTYNPFKSAPENSPAGEYNLLNPVKRDVVFVPSRGYAVIRFQADNKGIWMMHCHVGWHLGSGMAMSWDVR
ncbi:putative laccase [Exophiala viscosa]|uniref:Laccase n=1 Tax=Exophiala viscosa TaxID=2486360 RepID=A0AAN6IAK5_9EURO|nr:putative laccase [Exophiala viscosa]